MPLTQVDPVPALIIIDLQKGVVAMAAPEVAAVVIDRSAQLARTFRKRGWPVVLVNVTARNPARTDGGFPNFNPPADWTDLVPELERQASDFLVSKKSFGAFLNTPLDALLRERSVTQIFLAGVATSIGVESTARSAYDLGYNVVFVADAMADRVPAAHQHAIETIFPRLGEVDTTANVLAIIDSTVAR